MARSTLKHGVGHAPRKRRTATHHTLSAAARAHMSAARKGKPHPHKGHRGPYKKKAK